MAAGAPDRRGCGTCWSWSRCFVPALLLSAIEFVRKPGEWGWAVHIALTGKSALRPLTRAFLALVLLPYDGLVYLDAIVRSGVRMLFTRRGLMLWHLPSYGRRNARRTPEGFLAEMWIGPALAVVLALVLASCRRCDRPAGRSPCRCCCYGWFRPWSAGSSASLCARSPRA